MGGGINSVGGGNSPLVGRLPGQEPVLKSAFDALKAKTPANTWTPAKGLNWLVSSFVKVCSGIFSKPQAKTANPPLSERKLTPIPLAGRGHVQFNQDKGTITKHGVSPVDLDFQKEVHNNPDHPLRPFMPSITEVNPDSRAITMEDTSVGVKDRDNDVLDIKIGKRIANHEELLAHDYKGKKSLALGFKMFRMGMIEVLTGSRVRGYTFIPQAKSLQRIGPGAESDKEIGNRLANRSLRDVESVLTQLKGMREALNKSPENAFVGSSVLITFPEGIDPKVKMIDFDHRMKEGEFVSPEGKTAFKEARSDFLSGVDGLISLVEGEVQRREGTMSTSDKQYRFIDALLDNKKTFGDGIKQDYVGLAFATEKHKFGIQGGMDAFEALHPGVEAELRKAVRASFIPHIVCKLPLDHNVAIAKINTTVRQFLAKQRISREFETIFKQICQEKSKSLPLDKVSHTKMENRVLDALSSMYVSVGNKDPLFNEDPLTAGRGLVRKEIEKFLAPKLQLLDHVKGMALDESSKDVVTSFILKHEDVRSIPLLEHALSARATATEFIDVLKDETSPRGDVMNALIRLRNTCDTELKSMEIQAKQAKIEFGADEKSNFRSHAIELAMALSGLSKEDSGKIYERLARSKDMVELRHALVGTKGLSNGALATVANQLINMTMLNMGEFHGKTREETGTDIGSLSMEPMQLGNVPDDIVGGFLMSGIVKPGDYVNALVEQDRDSHQLKNNKGAVKLAELPREIMGALIAKVNEEVGKLGSKALDGPSIRDTMQRTMASFMATVTELHVREGRMTDIGTSGKSLPREGGTRGALNSGEMRTFEGKLSAWAKEDVKNVLPSDAKFLSNGRFPIPDDPQVREIVSHLDLAFILVITRATYFIGGKPQDRNDPFGAIKAFAALFTDKEGKIDFQTMQTASSILSQKSVAGLEQSEQYQQAFGFRNPAPPPGPCLGYKRFSIDKDPNSNGVTLKIESQGIPSYDRNMKSQDPLTSTNFVDYTLEMKVTPPPNKGSSSGVVMLGVDYDMKMA